MRGLVCCQKRLGADIKGVSQRTWRKASCCLLGFTFYAVSTFLFSRLLWYCACTKCTALRSFLIIRVFKLHRMENSDMLPRRVLTIAEAVWCWPLNPLLQTLLRLQGKTSQCCCVPPPVGPSTAAFRVFWSSCQPRPSTPEPAPRPQTWGPARQSKTRSTHSKWRNTPSVQWCVSWTPVWVFSRALLLAPPFFTSKKFFPVSLFYAFLDVLCHPECSKKFSP